MQILRYFNIIFNKSIIKDVFTNPRTQHRILNTNQVRTNKQAFKSMHLRLQRQQQQQQEQHKPQVGQQIRAVIQYRQTIQARS